ncbi:MAG TPA: RecX family transcriptional regulator [Candidatus Baltobacteraceae bacterium]|nr:RecX family transcriptional regulator [Candidatus Baltobacteraceae bacterium]
MTEAQLFARLERRGYGADHVAETVAACKAEGYVDDALFARLFIDGRSKALGDARLVADLVRRGIARDAARKSVASAERSENERLEAALGKLFRTRPGLGYPSAARALERLGFPAAAIYRHLRAYAREHDLGAPEDYLEERA